MNSFIIWLACFLLFLVTSIVFLLALHPMTWDGEKISIVGGFLALGSITALGLIFIETENQQHV